MDAHQLIYTSCKTGINAGGTGFQVYSCDEALYDRGFSRGTEYQRLLVIGTPKETGKPAFGYAHVEDLGDVFNLNTRLQFDYAGEGTRANSNVLDHALVIDDPGCNCYPTELYGISVLRTEMEFAEVNMSTPPAKLPLVHVEPAGKVNFDKVTLWLTEGSSERLEVFESMLYEFFMAREENKCFVIIDDPANAIWWIAALEYCLPLKLAKSICFSTYADVPGSGMENVVISTSEAIENNVAPFMRSSLAVFDVAQQSGQIPPSSLFIDFVDEVFQLNPGALSTFASFTNTNFDLGFDLTAFNDVTVLNRLLSSPVQTWNGEQIFTALNRVEKQGMPAIRARVARHIVQSFSLLPSLDSNVYMVLLGYLIRQWDSLDPKERVTVRAIVVDVIASSLRELNVSPEEFGQRIDGLVTSCAEVGLDVFDSLSDDEHRMLVYKAAENSFDKLRVLVLSMIDYIVKRNVPPQVLISGGAFATLCSDVMCLYTMHSPQAIGAVSSAIFGRCNGRFDYVSSMAIALEFGIHAARNLENSTVSADAEAEAIGCLWNSCLEAVVSARMTDHETVCSWLEWASRELGDNHWSYAEKYVKRIFSSIDSPEEAAKLYEVFSARGLKSDEEFVKDSYPRIASAYIAWLEQHRNKVDPEVQRQLLNKTLDSGITCDFVPKLVLVTTDNFDLKRSGRSEEELVAKIMRYGECTGVDALVGRPALSFCARLLERPGKNVEDAIGKVMQANPVKQAGQCALHGRDLSAYCERIAEAIMGLKGHDKAVFFAAIDAFGPLGDLYSQLLKELFDTSGKGVGKKRNEEDLALLCSYVVKSQSSDAKDACIRELENLSDEVLESMVFPAVENIIKHDRSFDASSLVWWKREIIGNIPKGRFGKLLGKVFRH